MKRSHKLVVAAAFAALSTVVAACTPPAVPSGTNFRFTANKVSVVNHNDTFLYGNRDEAFVQNLWFRVRVNDPNSAQVGISGSRSVAYNDLGDGETRALPTAEQGTVGFNNVKLLDVADLLNPSNKLEVVGTWTWAMEKDDVSVSGVQSDALDVLENALNTFVAAGQVPADANQLVSVLLGDFGDAFNLIAGSLFSSIPGIPDDSLGSRFYIGIGAKGALSSIVDAAVGSVSFPQVAIPVVSIPPDIEGGAIFSLGHNNSFGSQQFSSGGGRHDYDLSMVNVATLPKPPVASFTSTATSGTPPLSVTFDSSASSDPDGSIVSRNWSFGDFTTGAGTSVSHTFTTAGTFPVTLTVTDNSGMSHSATTNIAVGGAPTVAPTGLTKTGSGCCNTYGDFAWNLVPGATGYEINMDADFGGGCLTDHSAVIEGQVPTGRVQAFGLCLGTQYDVTIRARANGQWGPWSPELNINL